MGLCKKFTRLLTRFVFVFEDHLLKIPTKIQSVIFAMTIELTMIIPARTKGF